MPNSLFQLCDTNLPPIIKWPGGKEKELQYIFSAAPSSFKNYYEPFVGGGSIFAAIDAEHLYINDKSCELMALYSSISLQNKRFFDWIANISESWLNALNYRDVLSDIVDFYIARRTGIEKNSLQSFILSFVERNKADLLNLLSSQFEWDRDFFIKIFTETVCRKILRMQELESEKGNLPVSDVQDNILTALMGSVYMYFRRLFNNVSLLQKDSNLHTALFVFIRNYAYSGMFRYSKTGEFNVPYGGIAYNNKSLAKKIKYYSSPELLQHFSKTTLACSDFEDFFNTYVPQPEDFIFLDPPYDTEFSTYAQNQFTSEDQKRLADFLCNHCKAKWLLIIKNTAFIMSLYNRPGIFISSFDKKYQVSFMNRNNRSAEHLLISNYPHYMEV